MTTTHSTDLPVPRDALLELGLAEEQIEQALAARPLVVAFQADQVEGAWFDVERVRKALRALAQFRHTKGRWAGRRLKLGEGLDPWQVVWIIAPVFGWVHYDDEVDAVVRIIRAVWIEVPRKAGKALALDTPVPTPYGWTTQGELTIGAAVFAGDGTPTRVVAVTNVMNGRPCYRLTFSDGESVIADANHLWRTFARVQGRTADASGLRTTRELFETCTFGGRGDRNHSLSLAAALDLPDISLPVDPYVLGYWLGDGNTADSQFTVARGDYGNFAEQVAAAGYHLGEIVEYGPDGDTFGVRVSTSPIRKGSRESLNGRLRSLGVLNNKHLPMEYLRASRAQRLALLQGLMDSDGHISARGVGGNITRCEFTTINEAMASQVLELARTLGLKATLLRGRATISGRDISAKYRVTFTAHSDIPVFRLPRKLAKQIPPPATATYRVRSRSRQIVSVEPVESVPVRCIQVENDGGMYLVGRTFIPTHNSTISSGIGNVLLLADGETGAEVYAAAGDKLQAGRVFEDAKKMCLTSPHARKRVRALAEVIADNKLGGVFRVLSRVAEAAHGLNVSGAVIDEVHVHKRRDLVDAIETGTGAREQPLVIFITTADEATDGSIYDEKHNYTRKVAERIVDDPSHYGVIWAAEDTDDPFAEATWRKANPGLGVSPSLSYLRKEARKAESTPSYFPTFCRLHLNRRMRDAARLIDLRQWDACAGIVDLARLKGRRAWGGFDLSAVSDLTAWWLGVESPTPGVEVEMLWHYFVPEERVEHLERHLQVPLSRWVKEGWITATEGNVIDYAKVRDVALADCRVLDVQRISYDRMFAGQMVQEIDAELKGVEVVPVAQTFVGQSPSIKELLRLLGVTDKGTEAGSLRHGGDPVTRWMASVVETKGDGQDNYRLVKPDRGKSQARIDGIAAMTTGLDGYLRRVRKTKKRMVVRG